MWDTSRCHHNGLTGFSHDLKNGCNMAKKLSNQEIEELKKSFVNIKHQDRLAKADRRKKQFRMLFLSLLLMGSIGSGIFYYYVYFSQKMLDAVIKEKEIRYLQNAKTIVDLIMVSYEKCFEIGQEYSIVWVNAIVAGDNTRRKIQDKRKDLEMIQKISLITDQKKDIDHLMEKAEDPPKRYRITYFQLVRLYQLYVKMQALAKNPSGTRSSYKENLEVLYEKIEKVGTDLNEQVVG